MLETQSPVHTLSVIDLSHARLHNYSWKSRINPLPAAVNVILQSLAVRTEGQGKDLFNVISQEEHFYFTTTFFGCKECGCKIKMFLLFLFGCKECDCTQLPHPWLESWACNLKVAGSILAPAGIEGGDCE